MSYMRATVIDASVTGDTVKQAILDLDADLTLSFTHLNQLTGLLAQKMPLSLKNAVNGVAGLDADGLIDVSRIPSPAKLPVGSLLLWPTPTVPDDYLECNGAELVCLDYPDLFTVIGYTYGGVGNSFCLPDWRGYFPRGWAHGVSLDPDRDSRSGGDAVGSTQTDQFKAHRHNIGGWVDEMQSGSSGHYNADRYGKLSDTGDGAGSTPPGGSETRPVNQAVMFCIKWR